MNETIKTYRILTWGFDLRRSIWEEIRELSSVWFHNYEPLHYIYERNINGTFETIRSNYKISYINLYKNCRVFQISEIWNEINIQDINKNIYYWQNFN